MKTEIEINGKTLTLHLEPVETDFSASWRNGIVSLPDGAETGCGGGFIHDEASANQADEEAGIAGGMRQGVHYPNETAVGSLSSYSFADEGNSWEEVIMPFLYGENWEAVAEEEHDGKNYLCLAVYEKIQTAFVALHDLESES